MVFAFKCFTLCFEDYDKYEAINQAKSAAVELFHTTCSNFSGNSSESVPNLHSAPDTNTITYGTKRWDLPSVAETTSNLRVFELPVLEAATGNFATSSKIGEGGFGSVYRGVVMSSEHPFHMIDVAVKKHDNRGSQGHKEWVTEVNVLGKVEHPNLVKLLGYCVESGEDNFDRLLVYEYMPNGSVHDHLSSLLDPPLSWAQRLRIALDTARGLAFLHEAMDYSIIMRDFKASNVLLDEQWNAKLSDFGYARLGPLEGHSHVTTRVAGTHGYSAPEYTETGHLTVKCDVFSYGAFLYVLITGQIAWDPTRSEERILHKWVKPYLINDEKFSLIVDPRIRGQFPLQSARKLSNIAEHCLFGFSKSRPSMSRVSDMLCRLVNEHLPLAGAHSRS